MQFTIESFNKQLDMFTVLCETGERGTYGSYAITVVMCQGHTFTNAKLTTKGFVVNSVRRNEYIQVPNIDNKLRQLIKNKIDADRKTEEQKKLAIQQAIKAKKPVAKIVKRPVISSETVSNASDLQKKKGITKIYYRGNTYYSIEDICKKFNAPVDKFKELYAKGYSPAECLGHRPLRSKAELENDLKRNRSALDSMAHVRGDM